MDAVIPGEGAAPAAMASVRPHHAETDVAGPAARTTTATQTPDQRDHPQATTTVPAPQVPDLPDPTDPALAPPALPTTATTQLPDPSTSAPQVPGLPDPTDRDLTRPATPTTATAQLPDPAAHTATTAPAAQQPDWPDPGRVAEVRRRLRGLPPPVSPGAVDRLHLRLAEVAHGRALLLQGGDCAETFAGNTTAHVRANLRTLLHTATLLEVASGLPVVPVGRIAGQYAKPRSQPFEASGLPSYRGDIVNATTPTAAARTPDPERLLRAHADARTTLDVLAEVAAEARTELFAGHEALLLDYEVPLTRRTPGGARYGLSGHFLWIGERTRQVDGAHVEFARGLANPLGVKVGPGTTAAEVLAYADALDPHRTPGRLTLISRMGADRVADALPPLVAALAAAGHPVIWLCDPMHGNTRLSASGYKTRHFDAILAEVRGFFAVHAALGTHPGGLHLEFTGDDVTECLGGSQDLRDADLPARYHTACDPRLNARQSLDLACLVAEILLERPRPTVPRQRTRVG